MAARLEPALHPFYGGRRPSEDGARPTFAYLGLGVDSAYDAPGTRSPAADAPDHVRAMSWEQETPTDWYHYDFDFGGPVMPSGAKPSVVDFGDVVADGDGLAATKAFATKTVRSALAAGALPFVVGGDHSITSTVVAAYEDLGPVNVLHVDAHLDFRDEVDGVRDGYSSPIRRVREMPWVGSIVQVGLRGVGSARAQEVHDAERAGNMLVTAERLHGEGIGAVTEHLSADAPWYVTIDVDGLDPSIAPGTGFPVPDGVTYRQAAGLIRSLGERGLLAGIDITEIHPAIDLRGLTALTALRLLVTAMATAVRGSGSEERVLPAQLVPVS
jgi:agmatinase